MQNSETIKTAIEQALAHLENINTDDAATLAHIDAALNHLYSAIADDLETRTDKRQPVAVNIVHGFIGGLVYGELVMLLITGARPYERFGFIVPANLVDEFQAMTATEIIEQSDREKAE